MWEKIKSFFSSLFGKVKQDAEKIESYAHQEVYAFDEHVESELVYLRACLGDLTEEKEKLWKEIESLVQKIKE